VVLGAVVCVAADPAVGRTVASLDRWSTTHSALLLLRRSQPGTLIGKDVLPGLARAVDDWVGLLPTVLEVSAAAVHGGLRIGICSYLLMRVAGLPGTTQAFEFGVQPEAAQPWTQDAILTALRCADGLLFTDGCSPSVRQCTRSALSLVLCPSICSAPTNALRCFCRTVTQGDFVPQRLFEAACPCGGSWLLQANAP
jgi:hypothetical protein